jgi:penicillin-binding protein 1A
MRGFRLGTPGWTTGVIRVLLCTMVISVVLVAVGFHHIYLDRTNLPDIEPFIRFEFPTIGHIYDIHGQPLVEMAKEYRRITTSQKIPPIVRDAILAAEDKHFFSHSGVDYSGIPRVLRKVRVDVLLAGFLRPAKQDAASSPAVFPQGGSTITQQLVRGYFLQDVTAKENSSQLRHGGVLLRAFSCVIGARNVNMVVRKVEEIRLSFWVEKLMQARFGSQRRAKEEILARYATLIYMGSSQYGIGAGAEYYFGRALDTFTVDDADKAALLAGVAKSARYYAPNARDTERVLRRRNQILTLMAANGFITRDQAREAGRRPIQLAAPVHEKMIRASAVVDEVLEELKAGRADLSVEDLQQGRIQVYSTVDVGVQRIVNEALEHGLELFEKRHPSAKGLVQGSVVVLRNRDAGVVAEAGGRQSYQERSTVYSDFNRVTKSLRQPGSAMKPFVYLAAFRGGTFDLESLVPDEPISVPNGEQRSPKWISNYDGEFQGLIPLRKALAESRNAVAIWITGKIGIGSILQTAQNLGIQTPLHPYATTALGASEVNLLELANAYRAMASGILAQPYVVRRIVRNSGEVVVQHQDRSRSAYVDDAAVSLIQEGLRGVVRMPTGTGHALDSRGFPIAVMGKTGTTNNFKDALFVGSTYGPEGITVAVRMGFDDGRSLGPKETGGRVALPVFRQIVLNVYRANLVGPAPAFPPQMERSIDAYLQAGLLKTPENSTTASKQN